LVANINCLVPPDLRTNIKLINISLYQSGKAMELKLSRRNNSRMVQLVSELDITGGDKRKVGYYAGLIVRNT
jgi:hypothetical protein